MKKEKVKVSLLTTIIMMILVAIATSCIAIDELNKVQNTDDFWETYAISCEKLIDELMGSDCDYIYDVIMEGENYDYYYYLRYESHKR